MKWIDEVMQSSNAKAKLVNGVDLRVKIRPGLVVVSLQGADKSEICHILRADCRNTAEGKVKAEEAVRLLSACLLTAVKGG